MILTFKSNGYIIAGFNDETIKEAFPNGRPSESDEVDLWGSKYKILSIEFVSEDNYLYLVQPVQPQSPNENSYF